MTPSRQRARRPPAGKTAVGSIGDAALRDLGGDESLMREVVGVCAADTPGMVEQLAEAVESGDADAVNRHAHSLKGSLLFLGQTPAVALAKEMEACGRDDDLEAARTKIAPLQAHFEELLAELSSYLAGGG